MNAFPKYYKIRNFFCKSVMNKKTKITKIAFDILTFTYFKNIQQWKNLKK